MTRRELLRTASASPVVMLPSVAPAFTAPMTAPTKILDLYHRIAALNDAGSKHVTGLDGEEDDEEMERLFYRERDQLTKEMMATPCTCAADFAAKTVVSTCEGSLFDDWETGELWIEARALIGKAH